MPTRKAEAEWKGNLAEGNGTLKVGSGAFEGFYSLKSRFEDGQSATNPEELLGAAHAGCFTMALAQLSRERFTPTRIHTEVFSEQLNCSTKPGMRMHTVAPLCDFPQDSRILRHNPEQRTRSARGGSTTLFPVLQRANRDPKQLSELRL